MIVFECRLEDLDAAVPSVGHKVDVVQYKLFSLVGCMDPRHAGPSHELVVLVVEQSVQIACQNDVSVRIILVH
jgi:hypothetical protein